MIEIDDERRKQICINFLEAIEWNMKYYTIGCPNWRWAYKYDYPPLLCDLIKYIPYFDTEFVPIVKKEPVHHNTQLAYVLPRTSLHLLPLRIQKILLEKMGENYRLDYSFKWSFCKYFWESHVHMPEIDINALELILK